MHPDQPPRPPHEELADVEEQADALSLLDRDAEVAELRRAEYAAVDLASRLHGAIGSWLAVSATGPGPLEGVLTRVGEGWLLLDAGEVRWVLSVSAVWSVRGLGERSVPPEARALESRLGLGSVLRSLSDERAEVVLHRGSHGQVRGSLGRVGADFVEVRGDGGRVETVPLGAVTAVRCG